jgi:hypothetical protein
MPYKLGKLAPKVNSKTLLLKKYTAALPSAPAKVYREYKVPPNGWGMYGNDTIGDCTCACAAHMEMLWTIHTGSLYTPNQQDIISAYSAVSGYDPKTGANDNGAAISDVLNLWQSTGIAGRKIVGWAQIDNTNIEAVKQAIWLFGAIDIGVQLPNSAMTQFNEGQPWTVLANDGGIDGGHSVPLFGYGSQGANCNTWATRQGLDWDWFLKYCDEAYCAISPDWLDKATNESPSGFDLATLQADLNALSS